jgi:hypothetical protein
VHRDCLAELPKGNRTGVSVVIIVVVAKKRADGREREEGVE